MDGKISVCSRAKIFPRKASFGTNFVYSTDTFTNVDKSWDSKDENIYPALLLLGDSGLPRKRRPPVKLLKPNNHHGR